MKEDINVEIREKKIEMFSQLFEDVFIYNNYINKGGVGLICVEIGAFDGVTYSNSLLFERECGAYCVLIEPSLINSNKIRINRPKAALHQFAVSSHLGTAEFVGDLAVSGLAHVMTDKYISRWDLKDRTKYNVITVPTALALSITGIEYVDFLSIDVQGAELQVLETMDWSLPTGIISIELEGHHPDQEEKCRNILRSRGFTHIQTLKISEIWVNTNYDRLGEIFDPERVVPLSKIKIPNYAQKHLNQLESALITGDAAVELIFLFRRLDKIKALENEQSAVNEINRISHRLQKFINDDVSRRLRLASLMLLSDLEKKKFSNAAATLYQTLRNLAKDDEIFRVKARALSYELSELAPRFAGCLNKAQVVFEFDSKSLEPKKFPVFSAEQADPKAEIIIQERFQAARMENSAPIYLLNNAHVFGKSFAVSTEENLLVPNSLYLKERTRLWDHGPNFRDGVDGNIVDFGSQPVLLAGNGASSNYYHWLLQSAQSIYLYGRQNLLNGSIVLGPKLSSFARDFLKIMKVQNYYEVSPDRLYFSERCYATNVLWSENVYCPNFELLEEFSQFLLRGRSVDQHSRSRIYISRLDVGRRNIENETEVCKLMRQYDYQIVECSKHSVSEQIQILSHATNIVAPHGAALSNILFSCSTARVHEIFQDTYLNPCFYAIARAKGHDYSCSIHKTIDSRISRHEQSYRVDIDCLRQVLDFMG